MANWKIEIDGTGIHDNGRADDADVMAKDCEFGAPSATPGWPTSGAGIADASP